MRDFGPEVWLTVGNRCVLWVGACKNFHTFCTRAERGAAGEDRVAYIIGNKKAQDQEKLKLSPSAYSSKAVTAFPYSVIDNSQKI